MKISMRELLIIELLLMETINIESLWFITLLLKRNCVFL